jgi:hypothetical protein
MPTEPLVKRAVVFIDGQNLYHSVRESFGYTYPNYSLTKWQPRSVSNSMPTQPTPF